MKYFIPKSYLIRHKILEFSSKERMKNGGLNPPEEWRYTIKQICKNIGENFNDVNIQLDYLFYKKLINCNKNESELTNPFCFATDEGVTLFSSKSILNDGLLFRANVFSNISTGFFQIIIAFATLISLWLSFIQSNKLAKKLDRLELHIEQSELNLKELKSTYHTKNNSGSTKEDYQINATDSTNLIQTPADIK